MKLKINESDNKPIRVKISGENFLSLDFGTCLKNYFDSLNESSLKRVLKHQNDFGMVMISASRRFEDVKRDVASTFPDYSDLIENEENRCAWNNEQREDRASDIFVVAYQ